MAAIRKKPIPKTAAEKKPMPERRKYWHEQQEAIAKLVQEMNANKKKENNDHGR